MNTTDRENKRYLEHLTIWLSMRDVGEGQVSDILAEAQAHVDVSGETLTEAFGPPRHYARQWGTPYWSNWRNWLQATPAVIGSLVGATALGSGAMAAGRGEPELLGLPPLWVALIGFVVWMAVFALTPLVPVRDPRTGETSTLTRPRLLLIVGPSAAVVAAVPYLLGLAQVTL
jgi:hypothetical protein